MPESDSVNPDEDAEYLILRQLLAGRTKSQRALAVNMVKLMFGYLDENSFQDGKGEN